MSAEVEVSFVFRGGYLGASRLYAAGVKAVPADMAGLQRLRGAGLGRWAGAVGRRWGLERSFVYSTGAQTAASVEAVDQDGAFDSERSASLSLPGGNVGDEERKKQKNRIRTSISRLKLPEYAKLSEKDVIWVNKNLALVGTGLETNLNGVRAALESNVFQTSRVVTVRDVFERRAKHATLTDTFKLLSDDVTAILSSIQRGPTRRLCNEWVRREGSPSTMTLLRHDMDFIEYLHEGGFRIVPVDSQETLKSMEIGRVPPQQSTNHVLMVAPTAFEPNADAQKDNFFMAKGTGGNKKSLKTKVVEEFESLHARLTSKSNGAGLRVHLFTHEPHHATPDAVFPNNWFSTHTDLEVGECTLCLYPMKAPTRRKERRPEFIDRLHGFSRYTNVYDMTRQEAASNPKFLEGTGSLVLDRINRIAYAAVSDRTDVNLANVWGRVMNYTLVPFLSVDKKSRPIYHTNVMMAVGTKVAIVCSESIQNQRERDGVMDSLKSTGHEIVDISLDQVDHFCGNVLEVENYYGKPVLAMSTQAHDNFTPEQRATLLQFEEELIHADISNLEAVGGGGVRCSIGELF